ncbi:MAG: hypothetical protein AB1668_05750 [Nanoarchaeota archaeon]
MNFTRLAPTPTNVTTEELLTRRGVFDEITIPHWTFTKEKADKKLSRYYVS